MSYTRTTTINSAPGGDSVKQAVLDLDTDLTGAFTHLNTVQGDVDANQVVTDAHASATSAHGATGAVVGTTNTQTLTNKTLTSPKINEDVALTATATELNVLDGITASTAELNYVDGVTSAIQAQLNGKSDTSHTHVGLISDGDKGDITVSNSGATWTVDVKDPYMFYKLNFAARAFTKTAAQTMSVKAGTQVIVAGVLVTWSSDTAITMPSHTLGTDYYIYACADGSIRADANASAPTGYNTTNSRKIGGYHYGRVRNTLTVTDVATEIVPLSIWDLTYRPKCDPAGMVDVHGNGSLWADIYLCSVNAAITLTSGVITAGSCKSAYNSTPLSGTEGLHGYNFIELAKNSGKRLLTHSEWLAVAHGSPQGNDGDNLNSWSATTNGARSNTGQVARAVSFAGAVDCGGNLWEWLDEFSNDHTTTAYAWQNPMTGQNVGQLYIPNASGLRQYLAGGSWSAGVIAGSRALYVGTFTWNVNTSLGSRFACDGL